MPKNTWGASATMATAGLGHYGARGYIVLPTEYSAVGIDAEHYFDAYIGFFTSTPENAFCECGIGFYGELHRNKNLPPGHQIGKAFFPNHWSTLVNPANGHLVGQPPLHQRNELYSGSNRVSYELEIASHNLAYFKINGRNFRGTKGFTFGYTRTGVSEDTFKLGFNIKICIGLNDKDGGGVTFKDMKIGIDSVLRLGPAGKKLWKPGPMSLVRGLSVAQVEHTTKELTVSYPKS